MGSARFAVFVFACVTGADAEPFSVFRLNGDFTDLLGLNTAPGTFTPVADAFCGGSWRTSDDVDTVITGAQGLPATGEAFTMAVDVKALNSGNRVLVAIGTHQPAGHEGVSIVSRSDGVIAVQVSRNSYVTTVNINDNLWHHLKVTFDGTWIRFYENSVLQREIGASAPLGDGEGFLGIGGWPLLAPFGEYLLSNALFGVGLVADHACRVEAKTAVPTTVPPTNAPPTDVPPTNAPPTGAPPTKAPPTNAPPTDAPPTN
eukprot:Rhum_TRINITY_DN14019_c0_g2::Rhum_TRINITY_DN14019_c0_g2_i1::g.67604::m.67604